MNNIVIVVVCAKCLKLIASEENVRQKKNTLVSGNASDEKNIHWGGRNKKKFYQFK